jgi:hypothetical protein
MLWISDMVIVLEKVFCVFDVIAPPPLFGTPGVVVTTATLHSNCIACPNWNNPTILVSTTSSCAQLLLTRLLI